MTRRRFLKPVLFFMAAALLITMSYALFWYGTFALQSSHDGTSVFVGEQRLTVNQFNSGVKLRPGKYEVLITGPTITSQRTTISINPFRAVKLANETTPLDLAGVLEYVAGSHLSSGYRIAGGQLFENNTWLVVRVGSISGQFEGYTDIYHFNDREWEIFDSGTGFDVDGYSDSGYPESVTRYLNGER